MARPFCCGHAACRVILGILALMAILSYRSDSATHFVLKKSGVIEERPHSPYNLKKPDDIFAFMEQEEHINKLQELQQVLTENSDKLEKADIEKEDDKLVEVEADFHKSDTDCLAAPRRLVDLDLFSSTYLPLEKKGIKMSDHLTCSPGTFSKGVPQVPDCRKPALDFSPRAFEHLSGVQARNQLPIQPEPPLHGAFPDTYAVQDLGSCLKDALDKNSTSWVLLNIAALYWRIHGHYHQATECLRRALHYSPPRHRDVALLSLGNVLHRSQHSKDAVILILSAIDLSPHLFIHHFTLGNVYAVNREWNMSAESYMRAHKIEASITTAKESMHAVRCQQKLEDLLTQRQQTLERTLRDLEDYQAYHLEFQRVHRKFKDNINMDDSDVDPFFYPLNNGLFDEVMGNDDLLNLTAAKATKHAAENEGLAQADAHDCKDGKPAAPAKDDGSTKSNTGGLAQCPAGAEVKASVDPPTSSKGVEEMCSAEDAIHHGQSLPDDAPEEEKDQCLVTEVTTEEIEDLRSRMDWVAASDLSDSSFSVEQARKEFEKIINSLDDADPQLIALVKERLKSLSSSRLGLQDMEGDDFNLVSAYEKLTGKDCSGGVEDEEDMSQVDSCSGGLSGEDDVLAMHRKETGASFGQQVSNVKYLPGKKAKASTQPATSGTDDVVMVVPDVSDDEEVDAYEDQHVQSHIKSQSSVRSAERVKPHIAKCERPRQWIMRNPELNPQLSAQERVPCHAEYDRPAKLSERVCHRYGEKQFDKFAIEVGKPIPEGLDMRFYPFVFDRRGAKQAVDGDGSALLDSLYVVLCERPPLGILHKPESNPTLPPSERVPCNAEAAQHSLVKYRVCRRYGETEETPSEFGEGQLPEDTDVPITRRVRPRFVGSIQSVVPPLPGQKDLDQHRREFEKDKEAVIQAAATAAVQKVANEMIKPNAPAPSNKHPPKLTLKPKATGPKFSGRTVSVVPKSASDSQNDAEVRWVQEQTRFVGISEEKRLSGPQLPNYLTNSSWDEVYGRSPRTVLAMKRREDATAQKVLLERQAILSKIQLLPLHNAESAEEVMSYDEDARLPVYAAPEVTKSECEALPATPTWDHFPAVYLPPEARGVNVSELLAVGLPPSYIHPHPWTPPICVHYAALPHSMHAFDHLLGIQYRDQLPMVPEPALNNLVGALVDPETTLEEIGQRLTTAFEMSPQPAHWALFHIAGLFFRVVGNPFHALECLRRAVHYAPLMSRDVPLLSMGEMLHRTGQMADATIVLRAALDLYPEQVQTHLALGNAFASNGQFRLARLHHSYACTRQPTLEAACLAVRYDECYARREVPQEIVNAAFRKHILPSCSLNKCELSDTPLRRKYEVISHKSIYLGSPELPEVIYRNDSVMRKHYKRLSADFVKESLKRLAAAKQEHTEIVAKVREMIAKDRKRIELLLQRRASSVPLENTVDSSNSGSVTPDDVSVLSRSHGYLQLQPPSKPPLNDETCGSVKHINLKELTSTWLSVEVKKIIIGDHIDITTPEPPAADREKRKEPFPVCAETMPFSAHMMDHLEGVQDRQRFEHVSLSEPGLSQVLIGLGGKALSLNAIAERVDDALKQNETSWVVLNMAALIWRVKGRADQSIRCLRQALHYSPRSGRDVALVSLANVMARSRLFRDSLVLMSMALEVSPNFVVHHFTIANILAATENYKEAEFFYRNTLTYQPDFLPAAQRYLAVRCKIHQGSQTVSGVANAQ